MSLIQEALKRQQEENKNPSLVGQEPAYKSADVPVAPARGSDAAQDERFSVPQEVPGSSDLDQANQSQGSQKHRVRQAALGIIALVVIAVVAGTYLIKLSASSISRRQTDEQVSAGEVGKRPEVAPAKLVQAPIIAEQSEESSLEGLETTEVSSSPPDVDGEHAAGGEPDLLAGPVVDEDEKTVEPAVSVVKISPSEEPTVEKPELAPPVRWPRLKLTAVLSGLEYGQNTALINGMMVSEGGRVDGVTLKSVEPDGAWLEFEYETRFLRMGASL